MKLIIAVIQDKDSTRLSNRLIEKNVRATKLASTGGFLKAGNTTFLIGVSEERLEEVLQYIKESGMTREQIVTPMSSMGNQIESYVPFPVSVQVGGGTVFVIDVEQFEQF